MSTRLNNSQVEAEEHSIDNAEIKFDDDMLGGNIFLKMAYVDDIEVFFLIGERTKKIAFVNQKTVPRSLVTLHPTVYRNACKLINTRVRELKAAEKKKEKESKPKAVRKISIPNTPIRKINL